MPDYLLPYGRGNDLLALAYQWFDTSAQSWHFEKKKMLPVHALLPEISLAMEGLNVTGFSFL